MTRATTISPELAESVRRITTLSPSRMPALIMESPWTSSTKCSPAPRMDSGTCIRSRSCWIASMGVPAAMRPRTESSRVSLAARGARGGSPGWTTERRAGPRPLGGAEVVACCGSLTTSRARARWGSRRRKPRSSRAVISLWMPDLDARSRASFISSNEGETPVSLMRSWMNMSSSCCLRVSISGAPSREQSNNSWACSQGVLRDCQAARMAGLRRREVPGSRPSHRPAA